MDEVDGMSSGDRGGMAELIQLIKKSKIPIICICNDRSSPKVRSLANYCVDLRFRRPDARMISPRISAICLKEGLQIGPNAIEELVASTHGDIRQILNVLSTYRLIETCIDYDKSKKLSGEGRKDIEVGSFDAVPALLGVGYNRMMSLSEKIDMYFVDSSLVPLMVQENYLKTQGSPHCMINGKKEKDDYSSIELYSAAADSISDADIVESLIRGSNQEWSLAPLHAVLSTVRPAYFCHGGLSGRIEFASWLGSYSKTSKNNRLLGELTKHTYLHTAAGRMDIRLQYLPVLAYKLLRPLLDKGSSGVEQTIALMDAYSLCREDFDSILELMLDSGISSTAYAKLPGSTKSLFTRKYNQGTHKLPYALGGATLTAKKIADIDAADTGDGEEVTFVTADDEDDEKSEATVAGYDLVKDKMIKAKTSTSTKHTTTASSARSRGSRGAKK